MSKQPSIPHALVEDVIGAVSLFASIREQANSEALRVYHDLGSNIVSYPIWKKGAWGQGKLYETLVLRVKQERGTDVSVKFLERAVGIYEFEPNFDRLEELLKEKGLSKTAHSVQKLLGGGEKKEVCVGICKKCNRECGKIINL